ncbi:hypothetical protein KIN20_036840 [Parelaphostrongylus tenuis]|uniref:Uncharacterized protein n=1 Tax=Parelaphostrongylus tenuis TaxID=148309 RepID=A0AAD5RDA4_PARTN|nr:hypothetical protein KIN20_036840 [Parelaphostrongylus tenuis]
MLIQRFYKQSLSKQPVPIPVLAHFIRRYDMRKSAQNELQRHSVNYLPIDYVRSGFVHPLCSGDPLIDVTFNWVGKNTDTMHQ